MKKIVLFIITALMLVVCVNSNTQDRYVYDKEYVHSEIERYGCEYWIFNWGHQAQVVHKDNCKYCKARRKQELKELVEQLKDK